MKHKSEPDDAVRKVVIDDGLWRAVVERNRTSTLPHVWNQCEQGKQIQNFSVAAGRSNAAHVGGPDRDSNVHKVMEGASYCLAMTPDASLDARMDQLIDTIRAAQSPDGYLVTYFISEAPDQRYEDLHRSHELYCMGHLIEAGVEHYKATGKRSFLDVAIRAGGHIDATFRPGALELVSGHQEIELALIKLYDATGDSRYLERSRHLVDLRGNKERVERDYRGKPVIEGDRRPGRNRPPQYRQDHLPPVDQRHAVGHAVRAGYLYAAMVDLAMAQDSKPHADAAEAIWEDIVSSKLYVTGGVGTHQYLDEGFGDPYLLPIDSAYCETCGGIALMLFSHRMGLMTGDARYADLIEKILLNHTLACPDHAGTSFFYRNPLESDGTRKRHPWTDPACCSTNVVRIIPQITRLAYAVSPRAIYVDQFASSTADLAVEQGRVRIVQRTDYPWDGRIHLAIRPEREMTFALHLRIPGWSRGRPVSSDLYTARADQPAAPSVTVNGEMADFTSIQMGYCVIERRWRDGDDVVLHLPMPVQRVYANPKVEACKDRVALMRGPLVYCLEEADNADLAHTILSRSTRLDAEHRADVLGGVTVIHDHEKTLTAIPYYAWNNRAPGVMMVWIPEDP